MKATIRLANESDALQMLTIYAPVVRETSISFEIQPPSKAEFEGRIQNYQQQMPWLVCEINGEILGYAYATPYRTRAAYQWSVESSVYVNVEHRRKGVAKALYTSLFGLLQLQGFYNVFAAIALPNPASVAVHEAVGFISVGVFRRVGYKFSEWHDIGWWQLSLQQELPLPIHSPLSLVEVQKLSLWNQTLRSGLWQLRI
ncbi:MULTISPECIES: arsinothricin resistance N-acetyltransferase ArsN1 family B [unclassified Nostoc]|uniref:arsinothricin resistance N-acetyltransferase ArsN1 family B n=1 Tax=unclassified Nostoc TaxID=2593658 RepID=UPI002AD2FAC9|nr:MULTISPECIES: arsinothricin resistance N-acetyltransferase ArsN1 family B [unclassified Nostoc]MDZ8124561.1 arsinothricin resistance N-acetyltransferase ArsN1 [Nostoc sp. CmiVER01]MDZ8223421.1 arsinothricin resistance N-acetyltransferase ArsN1 [Nostoc sp. ChiVER01]